MGKETLKNEVRKYEDQIDLVDLLKILIKNKGLILLITIIITASSLGETLFLKSKRIDEFQQNFILRNFSDSYYGGKAKLKIKNFNVEEMFLDDNMVNKFYIEEDFNKYYLEKIKAKKSTSDEKRKFLQDSIKLKKVMEGDKIKYYTVHTLIENEVLSKKMIGFYLDTINLKKVTLIKDAIEDDGFLVFQRRGLYGEKVQENEKKVARIITQQLVSILENQSIISVLSITNPSLLQEMENNKVLYKKYYDQAIGIEGLKKDKNLNHQIEILSSIYKVEDKSQSKKIVVIGMMMGLFLGIFVAFMKEFFANLDLKN